jgi:predicted ATPase with chaperone activity
VLKVARTIADLAGSRHTDDQHVTEALAYRGAFDDAERTVRAS